MDQIKIGKFISKCRKDAGLTQMQLAQKLNITDRAVSKWETGKALPDSSIMLELCSYLEISVTDLLCGERVVMTDKNKEMENKILQLMKEKEQSDKRLLTAEVIIGIICVVFLLGMAVVASYVQMVDWMRIVFIVVGLIPLLVATPFMLKIEQIAGYYHCEECGHKYVPTLKAVSRAPHMGRTRKMECPNCHKKSWQKKVISKD